MVFDRLKDIHRKIIQTLSVIPRSVWIAVGVSFVFHVVGLTFILFSGGAASLVWGDGIGYVDLAKNLHSGLGYVSITDLGTYPETFRTPGLPFLLSFFVGSQFWFIFYLYILTIFSAFLSPVLIWYIGKETFTSKAGIVAAWLLAIEPLIWLFSWFTHTEIPFLILSLLSVASIVKARKTKSLTYAVFAGIFTACAIYIRSSTLLLFFVGGIILLVYDLINREDKMALLMVAFGSIVAVMLIPWVFWVHSVTGVYAISGAGWRNVYTDYVASIRAIENGTGFFEEKVKLKSYAVTDLGIKKAELDSPAKTAIYKKYALSEIFSSPDTVVKLESILIFNYFIHTGYQHRFSKVGFLPEIKNNLSPSKVLLEKGIKGVPDVYNEMKRKFFLPIIERIWSVLLLILAGFGYIKAQGRARHIFLAVILLGALTSTAIGLGVEGRLRIPILPYYFLFVGVAVEYLFLKRHEKKQ